MGTKARARLRTSRRTWLRLDCRHHSWSRSWREPTSGRLKGKQWGDEGQVALRHTCATRKVAGVRSSGSRSKTETRFRDSRLGPGVSGRRQLWRGTRGSRLDELPPDLKTTCIPAGGDCPRFYWWCQRLASAASRFCDRDVGSAVRRHLLPHRILEPKLEPSVVTISHLRPHHFSAFFPRELPGSRPGRADWGDAVTQWDRATLLRLVAPAPKPSWTPKQARRFRPVRDRRC
jgi:hypothetical protein